MIAKSKKKRSIWKGIRHRLWVFIGAVALSLLIFLILPVMQVINKPPTNNLIVTSIDSADLPPPPPPPQEEPEEEPEPEETPPELMEESLPLDLSQLELALNPGVGGGLLGGDFSVKLNVMENQDDDLNSLFSMADLDQKPRVVYQPGPILDATVRKKAPGTVYVLFIVDEKGRVVNPLVQKSTDPAFDKPALAAIKQWKFEPGKRKGKAVRFRMRIPITFPKG